MDQSILATKNAQALDRIVRAADALGTDHDLAAERAALDAAQVRDPQITHLQQMEAVAALLEKVAGIVYNAAPYEITHARSAPAAGESAQGTPPDPQSKEISYEEYRAADGQFVPADKQDADGKPETITRAKRPTPPPAPPKGKR